MELAHVWLLTLVASVAATIYLVLTVRAISSKKLRQQARVVQNHPADDTTGGRTKDQNLKRLTIVYPDQTHVVDDTEVDVIAVHGLGSDADWSWVCKDGETHVNWLRDPDMLPAKIPKARIIIYRYDSVWHADAPKTRLQLCGEELVHSLHSFRAKCQRRPVIFVGHSLGGNVTVQAILYANDNSRYESLVKATAGLVFLGTPFRGSKWQPLADALALLMGPAGSHRGITRELAFDGPALGDRLHRFCGLRNKMSIDVACFCELHETDYGRRLGIAGVAKGMIVEETSAFIPGLDRYALDKDHLKINKYYGPNDPAFERVSNEIAKMCHRASNIVQRRFESREVLTDNHAALKYNPEAVGCLHDLFVTDPLEDKKALKRKKGDRAAGTCEWILGTEHLTAWLGSKQNLNSESHANQVLWLHGNPGTGKSTLAIFLTDVLSKGFSATDGKTLAYFFCDSAFDTRRTATSVVRGLLLQLIQQHPPLLSYVLPKYNQRKAKIFESFDALWAIFMSAAGDINTGRKYLIIDALDECDEDSQKTLLHQLQDTFHDADAPSNVRVLVTSRPYPEIRNYLGIFTCMDFACFPDAQLDIDRCIKERVTRLGYTEKIKERVTDILRYKAAGTFLWLGIACNELKDIPSKDAISVLEALPSGLHALYERLFSAALEKEREKDTIRLILCFVAVSQRPLTLLELSEACRLRQDEDDIETRTQFMREYVESCRLMVVVQDKNVLLLHQSVKDYLIKAGDQSGFSELQAHADLAYRCLDHFIEQFHNKKQNVGYFSGYATREWLNHARLAQSKFVVLAEQAEFFKIISPCRDSWLAAYHGGFGKSSYNAPPHQLSVLHVAARWGIPAIVQHVFHSYDQHITAKKFVHLSDSSHAIELECGIGESGEEVMALPGEQPVDEIRNENGYETSTLQQASSMTCSRGAVGRAPLLPEKDANDIWANNEGRTPLHWASENGHVEVVKLLLAYKTHPLSVISGASKITADIDHMTALHYTVSNTSEEMAQYLLDTGISINTGVARWDWSRSETEIKARCVPDNGSDSVVDCSIHSGLTALHYAALTGCKKMTEYLLAQGASPNARSVHDETPLHLALKRDLYGPSWQEAPDRWNDPVCRIEGVLDNIGYGSEGEEEYAATCAFIEQHRLAVVELLLINDLTDINAKDKHGATPLHCVKYENNKAPEIIKLLIERGADISARNDQGQTALHLACSQGSLGSVPALVKKVADFAAVDLEGRNAIHYAAQSGNMELVKMLAQKCPITLVATRDKRGRNALHHLVRDTWLTDEDAIESLVSAGVSVRDLDDEGSSPLSLYLSHSMPMPDTAAGVVRRFFQCGSDSSFRTCGEGLNLAHLHAYHCNEIQLDVLQTLNEFGVDLKAKDWEGRTLLHHCAIGGSLTEPAFHFLRDVVGIEKHVQDHHGQTSLQYAAEKKRKCDPDAFDSDRWSRTERILIGTTEWPQATHQGL